MSLVRIAEKDGRFKTLLHLVEAVGLTKTLNETEGLTIFAPTDEAFAQLGQPALRSLLRPENKIKLKRIILYHLLPMPVYAKDIIGTATPLTMEGKNLCVFLAGPAGKKHVYVNDSVVIVPDVEATNGVAHIIDRVLNPLESCASCLGNCSYKKDSGYAVRAPKSPKSSERKSSPKRVSGGKNPLSGKDWF